MIHRDSPDSPVFFPSERVCSFSAARGQKIGQSPGRNRHLGSGFYFRRKQHENNRSAGAAAVLWRGQIAGLTPLRRLNSRVSHGGAGRREDMSWR